MWALSKQRRKSAPGIICQFRRDSKKFLLARTKICSPSRAVSSSTAAKWPFLGRVENKARQQARLETIVEKLRANRMKRLIRVQFSVDKETALNYGNEASRRSA